MNDYTKQKIKIAVKLFIFFLSVWLVIIGQGNIGPKGLFIQLLGLTNLIFLLWDYNRLHK